MKKNVEEKKVKIIDINNAASNGQTKCPKCGATDISMNKKSGKLHCNFCRHEFKENLVDNMSNDISSLDGLILGKGTNKINVEHNSMLTLKCGSCGAEVVIDTNDATHSRCHWCRNTLSVNEQVPNGAVPDMVLPFVLEKEEARTSIEDFVKKRNFFANTKFKQEFTTENIMGVYLPYMVVDANVHATLSGQGEIETRKYTVSVGDRSETRYDADLYSISRDYDIAIDNLTMESNKDKLDFQTENKTNNVINAIMPFDIENCVKWDANYIKGFTSEKRNIDVEQLQNVVETQIKDVARFKANDTLTQYDRGVCWQSESYNIKGQRWLAAYLPVWLYSYQQVSGNKKVLHYVAVNARSKEAMGSVPVNIPKLLFVSLIVEIFGLIAMLFVDFDYSFIFLSAGFIYYFVIYEKYRNKDARHAHESETISKLSNVKTEDNFVKKRTGLSNSNITGKNNMAVGYNGTKTNVVEMLTKK